MAPGANEDDGMVFEGPQQQQQQQEPRLGKQYSFFNRRFPIQ